MAGSSLIPRSSSLISIVEMNSQQHEVQAKERKFEVGYPVFVLDFLSGEKWISGEIGVVEGPRSFRVILSAGHTVCRRSNHICTHSSTTLPEESMIPDDIIISLPTASNPAPAVTVDSPPT